MPSNGPGTSVTPTQGSLFRHGRSMSNQSAGEAYSHKDVLQPPMRDGRDGRSLSNANANALWGPRGASLVQSGAPPGSFSSDLKSVTLPRVGTPKAELGAFISADYGQFDSTTSEEKQKVLREKINKETKIKIGSENLLEALISKNSKQTKDQRQRVEAELNSSNLKLAELKSQLDAEIEKIYHPGTPPRSRSSGIFQGSPIKSPFRGDSFNQKEADRVFTESESPSYILAEILQALEVEGMGPDYYVERANNLVDLFKRYPSLKYDLAWSIFGLRIQTMLLSDSRDVVAAGYRVTRHAIADRGSLKTIRNFNTDNLVILSLVKDNKASIEREQALKFVRAFMDVKYGVEEISKAVLRTIVSIAEYHEDRLRNMALLTLSEIFIRQPTIAVSAGGVSPLVASLTEGTYTGSETLATAFLYLLDKPRGRALLQSRGELQAALTPFTDSLTVHGSEEKLRSNARLVASILKSWPGVFAFAEGNFAALRSLIASLHYPSPLAQDLILDLLYEVLRIRPPSWASAFLAGRRLTTYGRVASLRPDPPALSSNLEPEEGNYSVNLIDHFTTLLIAIFVHCGITEILSSLVEDLSDLALKRKATLLLTEVCKLADYSLPHTLSAGLQVMPRPMNTAFSIEVENDLFQTSIVYQLDSVNRTLNQSGLDTKPRSRSDSRSQEIPAMMRVNDAAKTKLSVDMEELQFRSIILDTQVLASTNYLKWKWDLINDIVEGPMLNPRRLDDAIKATKFLKRLVAFYRPFKHKFSDARNTKPNQRYVRTGCALIRTLLQNPEGILYLSENKLLRQLAESIAQLDPSSGLVSETPMLSAHRVADTLSGGYFALLGVLSGDPRGLHMIERWRMINMFYHIIDLEGRDDLTQALLGNMDFSLDSHLRVMLSKALTACPKAIRIYATKLLRKYVTGTQQNDQEHSPKPVPCEWALRLLVTQLYDPEVQVCEMAVQILEEACNRKAYLEYVVRCRPALDHLGEIGAPLLLRFLSTSLGYQYLDGLDYIGQEMDGWFHGRNTTYVTLVEASLCRALSLQLERPVQNNDEPIKPYDQGIVPPHFYRELTRTTEGCKLLEESGHFNEFVATIQDHWSEHEDAEVMLKVKGCLWAVGNVGSMDLGAPFLEETDVVDTILQIATSSEVITMRGTAFFVLGLISRSLHGMEIIAEHGWSAATDQVGRSLGFCLPPKLIDLFSIKSRDTTTFRRRRQRLQKAPKLTGPNEDSVYNRILQLTTDLGNTVLTKRAAADLYGQVIKNKSPEQFMSAKLLREVMGILEAHSFGLRVRRFVLDLFDKGMIRNFILDDDSMDDEESG